MKPIQKKRIKARIVMVACLFALLLSIIGSKAIYLQIFCYSDLFQKASSEYVKVLTARGKRGTIYDANGREMAVSIDASSIAAYPRRIKDPGGLARTLAKELRISENVLNRRLRSKRSFIWVKRQVTPKEMKAVKSLNLEGFDFIPEHTRFYPNRMLASQVLGFTGIDGRGLEGIEFYYERHLKPSAGQFTVLKDALGRIFARSTPANAEAEDIPEQSGGNILSEKAKIYSGNNLILTIDRTIQFIAERTLEDAVREYSAKSGICIVTDPGTGAVLALAHVPLFNPNTFADFDRELWRNKAITDPFEPGSTMKIFSAAAALESGICKPDSIFFCENGAYQVGQDVVHDTRPYGWLTLEKIIKYSSNIGVIKVSEAMGPETLHKTLRAFGFGEKTEIDCPGETSGTLANYQRWSKIDTGAIAFGQGISVSAIQLVTAVSAIANGGILMKPYIVQGITDSSGRTIQTNNPQKVRRVISPQTADIIKRMMKMVVESGGTGTNAAIKGYAVCGKTGTAQKTDGQATYAEKKYTASFVGFVPAENPRISILVVLDEPQKNHYGGTVAAPVFRKVAHKTLNHLGVPPRPEETDGLTALKN